MVGAIDPGSIRCSICDDATTAARVFALYPAGGDIRLVCTKPECVREFLASIPTELVE